MKYIDVDLLRKEIERRFWDYGTPLHDEEVTKKVDEILAILDTLQEQPVEIHIDNPNIEKIDSSIKVETRTDGTGDIDGKAMLYVAEKSYKIGFRDGKASKEQPASEDFRGEMREWVDLMVAASFPEQDGDYISEEDYRDVIKQTARHFYELGKNSK